MVREQLPDEGAWITAHTDFGRDFTGYIFPPHAWQPGGVLCLSKHPHQENDSGNNVYHYIQLGRIAAWTWDCEN